MPLHDWNDNTRRTIFKWKFPISFIDLSALPTKCRKHIQWAYNKGQHRPEAETWYGDMKNVVGIEYKRANIYDFVRFFKCVGRQPEKCPDTDIFWPTDRCSKPPCNKCLGETLK